VRRKRKIETLKEQMRRLVLLKVEMLATPDQQIDPELPERIVCPSPAIAHIRVKSGGSSGAWR
jgi:hypothetical protein